MLQNKNISSVKAASYAIGIKKVQYFSEKLKNVSENLPLNT